jgi:hypothetical protein
MADLILPDPRMEMPELFEPGRKPVGSVVIDREHWAGKHCIRAFVPQASAHDLIDGPMTGTIGASIGVKNTGRGGNPVALFDGTPGNKFVFANPIDPATELTVLMRVRRETGSTSRDGGLYSEMDNTNWVTNGVSVNFRANYSSGLLWAVGNKFSITENNTVPLGEWFDVSLTWVAGTEQNIFYNGIQQTFIGASTGPSASFSKSTRAARVGAYFDESSQRTLTGDVEYIYIFDKLFNADQRAILSRNPYQFLIPA